MTKKLKINPVRGGYIQFAIVRQEENWEGFLEEKVIFSLVLDNEQARFFIINFEEAVEVSENYEKDVLRFRTLIGD